MQAKRVPLRNPRQARCRNTLSHQIFEPPEAHSYYAAKFDLLATTVGAFRAQQKQVNGKVLRFRRGFEGNEFDLIRLMDVLEHVDEDVALLADAAALAKPGTPVFITVPAF